MIEYLNIIDDSVISRYNTLEKNIKTGSNSFYDAYLALLESVIKKILDIENIEYDSSRTCGYFVRADNVKSFFLDTLLLNEVDFNKFADYIKKVNDHKHKKEKNVNKDGIVGYMRLFHTLINKYYFYKTNENIKEFDEEYYRYIFGITERENLEYKKSLSLLKDEIEILEKQNKVSKKDLDIYKELMSTKVDVSDLEYQNSILLKQINELNQIKYNSLEMKLNKTLDMLLELQEYLVESRAVSLGVGYSICGEEDINYFINKARGDKDE